MQWRDAASGNAVLPIDGGFLYLTKGGESGWRVELQLFDGILGSVPCEEAKAAAVAAMIGKLEKALATLRAM